MATQTPKPEILVYNQINKGKFKSVFHYQLHKPNTGNNLLSEKINLSRNQHYAQSKPDYWLKKWLDTKWSGYITGLFKTSFKGLYWGDIDNKQHLIIVYIEPYYNSITIYIFKNYFSRDLSALLHKVILSHQQ